jgi:hypothetical protein
MSKNVSKLSMRVEGVVWSAVFLVALVVAEAMARMAIRMKR